MEAEDEDALSLELDAEGRIAGSTDHLDCESRVVQSSLSQGPALDELLTDCALANCGFVKDTFWVQRGAKPRCSLEDLALQIFKHHTQRVPEEDFGQMSGELRHCLKPLPSTHQTSQTLCSLHPGAIKVKSVPLEVTLWCTIKYRRMLSV
eukprot:CAMPEP_0172605880 /NCGR_PEP_ID=MMETSP1068-20121228/26080_1 /TAXON_ID=35684 /ORGANISM="Pseudopedinella elastica, Strain CCMP716" /LENGTH=149 /DNA_ID=CAMNT_0013408409 /DNA_START=249 /DNA_END=698 /DNA_ORIENTATION=+